MEAMDVCTAWGPQGPDCLALAIELQLDAQGAAAAEAAVGSPEAGAGAVHGQGCERLISHQNGVFHLAQLGRVHGGFPGAALALKATVGDALSGRSGARGHNGCSDMQWTSAR